MYCAFKFGLNCLCDFKKLLEKKQVEYAGEYLSLAETDTPS